MKHFIILILSMGIGLFAGAQGIPLNNKVLFSFKCSVGLGLIGKSKIDDMKIEIFRPSNTGGLPEYGNGLVTLQLSGIGQKVVLPMASVGAVVLGAPISKFNVAGYQFSWNDKLKSHFDLICQDNRTCTGSGILQGYAIKVVTCNQL